MKPLKIVITEKGFDLDTKDIKQTDLPIVVGMLEFIKRDIIELQNRDNSLIIKKV